MRYSLQARSLRSGKVRLYFALFLPFFAHASFAYGQAMTEAQPIVVPTEVSYNGSFTHGVKFRVPEQRGLEPRLGLAYDSGRTNYYGPNNLVGAGWNLTGLSSVERTNFRRAIPRFNTADIWVLDGEELVPCDASVEAGCGAGGTHTTSVESFRRIRQLTDDNTWEVTVRDGTRYLYKPLSVWATEESLPVTGSAATDMLENYRYLLAEKENTLGQKTLYDYQCDDNLDCRIADISYDVGEILFHWEERPDPLEFAAGRMLAKNTKRLRSVEIRAAGQMLRTYELDYITSESTGRSLLTSVTERGRDSVVDAATGEVTGGTEMPSVHFEYSGNTPSPVQVTDADAEPSPIGWPNQRYTGPYALGQFGNDEKVYGIYFDTNNNHYITNESPQRGFLRGFVSSGNEVERFYFIKSGHSRRKHIGWQVAFDRDDQSEDPVYGRPRIIGDVDGDGLDDVTGGEESKVYQRYTAPWSASSWSGYDRIGSHIAADINGDGLTDIFNLESGYIRFRLSNGSNAFQHVYDHSLSPYYGSWRLDADFNGDGTRDFLIANNSGNSYRIYYTVGEAMVSGETFELTDACPSSCNRPRAVGDLNSDGLMDIGVDLPNGRTLIYLNMVGSFQPLQLDGANYEFGDKYVAVGDVDVDGVSELVKQSDYRNAGFGAERWELFSERPDLLTFVTTPLGAETRVTYEKHIPETETDVPLELIVVSSLETFDGRAVRSTTDFSYSGARWAWRERKFLGFENIVATLPKVAGENGRPTIETTYMQDLASIGKVKQVVQKDGSGNVLKTRVETYDVQEDTKPYWSKNTEALTTTYFDGTPREVRETREFDRFGLVVKSVQHGDPSRTGGERVHTRWTYPNLDKYIVDKWAVETINSGTEYDYSANRVLRRWHYYDGANTAITEPPAFGLKTQTSEWTGGDPEDKTAQTVLTYDGYGTLTSEANALGSTTSYVYDSTYHLFPEEVRNPLYGTDSRQKKSVTWDKVCGVVLTETDENGSVTSHSYDPLCRTLQSDLPGGGRISYDYVNWGSPTTSYNRTSTLHPNGAGEIEQDVYFDGLGRTYREETTTTKQVASADPGTVDPTAQSMPYLASPIPDQILTENVLWQFTVPAGTFIDSEGDALVYSARQSNGSALPAWLAFDGASRTFSGTAPAGWLTSLAITVSASDGTGAGEDIFKVSVLSPNAPLLDNPISDQSVEVAAAWSFAVPADTFSDADEVPLSYSATLASGAPLPSWLTFSEASQTFTSTPLNRPVSLKVTASDGAAMAIDTFDLSTIVKENRVQRGWGIDAYLTRGQITLVSDTATASGSAGSGQSPRHVIVRGGNARITRFVAEDGKECTYKFIDLHEERDKVMHPDGSTTYSEWTSTEVKRGNASCG